MKVRRGFVSNSSSSSFLIRMDEVTKENFCKIVFGGSHFTLTDEAWQQVESEITPVPKDKDLSDYHLYNESKAKKAMREGKLYSIWVGNEANLDWKLGSDLESQLDYSSSEDVLGYENCH